jgi:hypothetical protein
MSVVHNMGVKSTGLSNTRLEARNFGYCVSQSPKTGGAPFADLTATGVKGAAP